MWLEGGQPETVRYLGFADRAGMAKGESKSPNMAFRGSFLLFTFLWRSKEK